MSAAFNANQAHARVLEAMREVIRRSPDIEDMGLCVRASEDTLRRMRDPLAKQPEDAWTLARLTRFIAYEQRELRTNRLAQAVQDTLHDHDDASLPAHARDAVRHARAVAREASAFVMEVLTDTAHDAMDPRETHLLRERASDLREHLERLQRELALLERPSLAVAPRSA
jgi:phosphoenolpyruvate-protein kinase (PTS system EI component)